MRPDRDGWARAVAIEIRCTQLACNLAPQQAYYRQGVALQCLGKHADALAAFASGLNQDSKSVQLLAGLVEAAIKSPLRGKCTYMGSTCTCPFD